MMSHNTEDQCFIEEEDGAENEADQGENVDKVLKEEDAETDPSEDGQSKTDEYIFYEENGNSQFKRLSQSVDDVIFGLDDSHHSDDEAQWSPLASRAQENEKVSERQWSPLASRAQENEKVSERQWSPLASRAQENEKVSERQWSPLASRAQENEKVSERQWSPLASRAQENEKVSERQWSPLASRAQENEKVSERQWSPLASRAQENEKVSERQWSPLASRAQENEKVSERQWSPLASRGRNSQESETAVNQSSSVDSSQHSSHNEPFEDDSGGMIHLVPSTDSNCTETDEDEPPPHVYHDMSPIQEETRGLIENLTNTTLSLTINGHRPMSAPREVFDTAPPPKEVIYVDIQTVFHKLSCVSNNINATRAALLVISSPMVLIR
jgi:hypothetical protein